MSSISCQASASTIYPSFLIVDRTSPMIEMKEVYSSPKFFSSFARIFLARAGLTPEVETATVKFPRRKKEGMIKSDDLESSSH